MYKNQKIGVVVPAYNEELLIQDTLNGMPSFIDEIFVINDCSRDNTLQLIKEQKAKDDRITIIDHEVNKGLGQSLIDGYLESLKTDVEISVVMAGDNQMDPDDLPVILDKVIDHDFDYVKGNRLLHANIAAMPGYRFVGNSILTILTKFATGYYSVMDPQSGYTAIKNNVLAKIPIEKMTKGYGYNADILCMLNIQGYRVADVEIKPVYGKEKSGIKLLPYIRKVSMLLTRLFFKRLIQRYLILDFHPLVLFYFFGFFNLLFLVLPFIVRLFYMYFTYNEFPMTTMIILTVTLLISLQSILFAIWMDMDYNKDKCK